MVSILLCGAGGKMGQVITQAVAQRSDCGIAAASTRTLLPVTIRSMQVQTSVPSRAMSSLTFPIRLPSPRCWNMQSATGCRLSSAPPDFPRSKLRASIRLPVKFLSSSLPICHWAFLCCASLPKKLRRCWAAILTSKLSKNTTIARWMPPAEPR